MGRRAERQQPRGTGCWMEPRKARKSSRDGWPWAPGPGRRAGGGRAPAAYRPHLPLHKAAPYLPASPPARGQRIVSHTQRLPTAPRGFSWSWGAGGRR